jgi:3-hydroxyacyl-[acyl-carrier-protein] dehydratase
MASPILMDLSKVDLERTALDRDGIGKILPHREDLALVDSMTLIDLEGLQGIGRMNVPNRAFWTGGHFPGNPLLPGVLLVEASAQVALVVYKLCTPEIRDRLVVFGGIENVRFRGAVRPGNRVHLLVKIHEKSRRGARASSQAVVDGRLVYEGDILAIVT